MTNLPNTELFKSFKHELNNSQNNYKASTSKVDLEKFHNSLSRAKHKQQELAMYDDIVNPSHLMYKNMFSLALLDSFPYMVAPILNRYIGYSTKYQSLTISVLENED